MQKLKSVVRELLFQKVPPHLLPVVGPLLTILRTHPRSAVRMCFTIVVMAKPVVVPMSTTLHYSSAVVMMTCIICMPSKSTTIVVGSSSIILPNTSAVLGLYSASMPMFLVAVMTSVPEWTLFAVKEIL